MRALAAITSLLTVGAGCAADEAGSQITPIGTWSAISTTGAPFMRRHPRAVWSGTEMVVWGGEHFGGPEVTGGRYDPALDRWRPTSTVGAPTWESGDWMVWAGTEAVVWKRGNGIRYDPVLDRWTAMSPISASGQYVTDLAWIDGRLYAVRVLPPPAGPELSRYDLATDQWEPVPSPGLGFGAYSLRAAGEELVVWGTHAPNYPSSLDQVRAGARFRPSTGAWTPMSQVGAPPIVTLADPGTRVLGVEGELAVLSSKNTSPDEAPIYLYRYDLADDAWTRSPELPTLGRLVGGGRWIVSWDWYDGIVVDRTTRAWAPMLRDDLVAARHDHAAVWTGTEMIIYGGTHASQVSSTGARYAPE